MKKQLMWICILAVIGITGCTQPDDSSSSVDVSVPETAFTETSGTDAAATDENGKRSYENMTAAEIAAMLTVEEKANQMVMPAIYNLTLKDMERNDYGTILSTIGLTGFDAERWSNTIDNYQQNALESDTGLPFVYGQDSVHGVNYCVGTVIFPHNINIGMANDPDLTYEMGLAVADEMKLSQMVWNFAPCVAVSGDPRWGRTYESYSSDPERVKSLALAFTKGQLEAGVIVCPKHYLGDGLVKYGTGETSSDGISRIIDRGDAQLSEEEIQSQLAIYKALIDEGVQTIMISHSSLNGVKMHENADYIAGVLRQELGFEGMVVSDWDSIQNIQSTSDYKQQIILAVNAGIDLLMEPESFQQCAQYLVEAVDEGSITEERMNEAVTHIIQMKMEAGVFDDPYFDNVQTKQTETGSAEYRDLARTLAEESLVLLQNDGILPIQEGTTIFVTGPAANDTGVQCGGWTRQWMGLTDAENKERKVIEGATTILEGLEAIAPEYGLTIITDEAQASQADMTLLCVGEIPYAEWNGDTEDLSLTGELGLSGNQDAIDLAASLGHPTVTLVVAGRNVILPENNWNAVVMCGLFGSEGDAVANVLTGKSPFTGTLSMPYYDSISNLEAGVPLYEVGYGLRYE